MAMIRSFLLHPTVRRLAQMVAGIIFLAAALPKLGDPAAFATSVHNFHLDPVIPVAATNLLAMTIPWVELLAGLALLLGIHPRAGAVVYTVLLLAFTAGVVAAMARGLSFECGCFGKAGSGTVGAWKLLENAAMTALGFVASVERR